MPAEVAASSWGSACVPGACLDLDNNCQTPTDITAPCAAITSGGSGRGCGASRRLSTSVSALASSNDRSRALRTPQANVAFSNANIENVTERSRYETHGSCDG